MTLIRGKAEASSHTQSDKRCAGGGASLGGQSALSYTRQITEGSESYRGRHSPSGGRDECPGNVLVDIRHTRTSGARAAFSAAGTQRRPPSILLAMFYCQRAYMAGARVKIIFIIDCGARDISLASCRKAGFHLTFHAMQARVSNHGARDISLALCRKAGPSYPDSNASARVDAHTLARAIILAMHSAVFAFVLSSSAHRKRSRPVLPLLWRGRHTLEVISQ